MLVVSPYITERSDTKEVINELSVKVKSTVSLEKELKDLDIELKKKNKEIENFKMDKYLEIMPHKDFIDFIGLNSKIYGVDVKDFKEDVSDLKKNNKIYDVTIQGDYKSIVKFTNGLYLMRNYFYMKDINLTRVELIPMSGGNLTDGNVSTKKIDYGWFEDYSSKIDRIIPSDIKEGSVPDSLKPYDPTINSEFEKYYKKPIYNDETIQLEFKIQFVDYEKK